MLWFTCIPFVLFLLLRTFYPPRQPFLRESLPRPQVVRIANFGAKHWLIFNAGILLAVSMFVILRSRRKWRVKENTNFVELLSRMNEENVMLDTERRFHPSQYELSTGSLPGDLLDDDMACPVKVIPFSGPVTLG